MLGVNARPAVAKVVAPVVPALVRAGITPDMVTITGTLGAVVSAVFLIGTGHLFWGAFAVWMFVMLDMLDGALARARGGGSVFGAVLDSTGDRAADAAIFGALAWWFSGGGDNRLIVALALVCLVLGVLTSYIKARAEGVGLTCDVGIVERFADVKQDSYPKNRLGQGPTKYYEGRPDITTDAATIDALTNHVLGDACTPGNPKECTFTTVRPVVDHCLNGDLDDLLS